MKNKFLTLLSIFSLLCTSKVWGYNASSANIYYDNTKSQWSSKNVSIMIGRDHDWGGGNGVYSQYITMSKIENTNLYVKTSFSWSNYDSFMFFTHGDWGTSSESSSPDKRVEHGDNYSGDYNVDMSECHLFTSTGTSKGSNINYDHNSSYTTLLNRSITVQILLSSDGGTTYAETSTFYGTISANRYTFTKDHKTSVSQSSKTLPTDGTNVTSALSATISFTESATSDGYIFKGWGKTNSKIDATTASWDYLCTGNETVYAYFMKDTKNLVVVTEDESKGTVTGSVSEISSFSNPYTIMASPEDGYEFDKWVVTNGSVEYAEGTSETNATAKINISDNVGIKATWKPKTSTITLRNYDDSKDNTTVVATYGSNILIHEVQHEDRGAGFTFNGYYYGKGKVKPQVIDASNALIANASPYTDSKGNWIYTEGDVTLYSGWLSNKYVITFNNQDATTAGTTTLDVYYSAETNLYNSKTGQKIPITVPVKTGCVFGGYYTETNGGGSQIFDTEGKVITSVSGYVSKNNRWIKAENTTLHAKWTENLCEVTVKDNAGENIKSVGSVTPVKITAADKEDWKFTSWTIDTPDNIHFSEGSTTSKTISITATGDATLTANYEELPKVYFDNNLGWEKVYVYFNVYWDTYNNPSHGAGAKGNPGGQMKKIGETNRYYYAYDVDSPTDKIAFTSTDQSNNNNFWATSAVYRKDFGAALPIFVSINDKSETRNETDYYNKGTWIKEDVNSGYYIIGSCDALGNWNKLDANQLKRTNATDTKATVAIQLNAGTYTFKLNTITDQYYGNGGTISTNVTGWTFEQGLGNCTIVASESGSYQFTFDFTTSKLDVSFPAYYLKYPWGTGLDVDWEWKKLDVANEDGTYSIYDLYAIDGKGIDYNTKANNAGATHIGYDDINKVGTLQKGEPARFTYNPQTNAVTIENMYFPITMNKYGYATLYHKENLQIPEGVTAKYVTGTSGVLLTYQEVDGGVIPKETGVMLFAPANTLMEFEGVDKANEEAPENIMGGSHDAETVDNSDIHYILTLNDDNQIGMFWPYDTDEGVGSFTNAANKAYIYVPGTTEQTAPVRARGGYLLSNEVNTPTEQVDVTANVNVNGKVLRNGQLIIIRDGIRYNALGEIVK